MTPLASDSAARLLAELEALGIQLEAPAGGGDHLRFRPREAVTADLTARMKAHKAELLAILATQKTGRLCQLAATWPADWQDWWEERAAIIEYGGNAQRDTAEERAFHELLAALLEELGNGVAPGNIPTERF